ncbi:hypothetical protein B0T20DRAFT_393388 [Sordaria brevicollis]|uniref:Uncharacterized protein n=1 Tax=Sordaria brevicollis TaxID=83679 RepID=A0AAE0UBF2_SORBR|nr:hypothetical protein B0T20DRAFT_393388 [Sordaria brevicollis]
MAYRSHGYKAHVSRRQALEKKGTIEEKDSAAKKGLVVKKNPTTIKTATFMSKKQNKSDEPHLMTRAEVRKLFAEFNADYEAAKKRGEYDDYVPAAGSGPNFSEFFKSLESVGKPARALANSMHAPRPEGN